MTAPNMLDGATMTDEKISAVIDQWYFHSDIHDKAKLLRFGRELLSTSKPVAQSLDFAEYRRGVREAFNVANIIKANPQGRTAEETCAYIVRSLAELANGGEALAASPAAPAQSGDTLTRELLDTLQMVVKHFTQTPSTLADSQARGKAHEVIEKAYAQIGYGKPNPIAPAESGQPIRTHTTQPGESVMGIALRQCGNEAEWRHILACNPKFADLLPSDYFPVGTVLTLPLLATATHPAPAAQSAEGMES